MLKRFEILVICAAAPAVVITWCGGRVCRHDERLWAAAVGNGLDHLGHGDLRWPISVQDFPSGDCHIWEAIIIVLDDRKCAI